MSRTKCIVFYHALSRNSRFSPFEFRSASEQLRSQHRKLKSTKLTRSKASEPGLRTNVKANKTAIAQLSNLVRRLYHHRPDHHFSLPGRTCLLKFLTGLNSIYSNIWRCPPSFEESVLFSRVLPGCHPLIQVRGELFLQLQKKRDWHTLCTKF